MQKELQADASEAKARYLIEHYQPQFLGEGGNHIVFSSPKHPKVVIKVDKGILKKTEEYFALHHIDSPDALLFQHAKEFMDEYRSRAETLKNFFPPLSILNERLFFTCIPIPDEIQNDGSRGIREKMGWGIVRVQDRLPTNAANILSIDSPYPERRKKDKRDPQRYWKTTTALLRGEECSKLDSSWIQPRVDKYIDLAEKDIVFRSALSDFLERAIMYTEATGQILDLVGPDNLVFIWNPSFRSWRFLLVDVLPSRAFTVPDVLKVFERFKNGEPVDSPMRSQLLNGLHWIRTVNSLASGIHLSRRIRTLASLVNISTDQQASLYDYLHAT